MPAPALTRRRALGLFATLAGTLGLGRGAAAQQKVSQADAKYQGTPKGQQRCEICVNFEPPNQCRFVVGPIAPRGWCQFFAARENAH